MKTTRRQFMAMIGLSAAGAAVGLRAGGSERGARGYRIVPLRPADCRPSDLRFCARSRFTHARAAVDAAARRGFACRIEACRS